MKTAFRVLRVLGALVLAGLVLAGCATDPQSWGDLARTGADRGAEHPVMALVAVNLPTPGEMDVLVAPVPESWRGDLVGGAFQNEVTVKTVAIKKRFASRAETCSGLALKCRSSAFVEGGQFYVPVPHGVDSATVISANGKQEMRVVRGIHRQLSPAEKSAWWETVRVRSGGQKIVLEDKETGEVMTVTPLSPNFRDIAAVSSMTEDWQRAAACGLLSVSTTDVTLAATGPQWLAAKKGLQGICYLRTGPNTLSTGG